jgi:hypothetical protein
MRCQVALFYDPRALHAPETSMQTDGEIIMGKTMDSENIADHACPAR